MDRIMDLDELIMALRDLQDAGCDGHVYAVAPSGENFAVVAAQSDGYNNGTPGSDGPELRLRRI